MSVHTKPDGRHYVSYRDESGKQRTQTFGRGDQNLKQAQAFDLTLQAQRKLGEKPPVRSGVYLDDLAQSYIKDRRSAGASDSYLQELKGLLNNHILKLLCHKPVNELTYEDMMRVADHYEERSQSTRNRYFGYLRAIFRFGVKYKFTKNNPLEGWSKKKELPRRSQLTLEDLQKIIAHAEPHLKWALEVEWNLGTRPGESELLLLKWGNVDFTRGVVSVFANKTQDWRDVPVSDKFIEKLQVKKTEAKTASIIEYRGRSIKKFRRSFRTACKRAGIPYHCIMYDVRHLFATTLLRGGADLAAVSKLLGHASTKMTADVYYEVMKGEKSRAISLLPPLKPEEPE